MPELPEVETVVRDLRAHGLEGARIIAVVVRWARTISNRAPKKFAAQLAGRTITGITRRAKFIVLALDNNRRLLIHLRMTGKLRLTNGNETPGAHDHVLLTLEDGRRLVFNDTRKFGRFTLCEPHDNPFAALGPEPLDAAFTAAVLRQRLAHASRAIKPLLLDQSTIAGLGNIYVDESLWRARIHPLRKAATLTAGEITRLHRAIRHVLEQGISHGGTTLGLGADNFYSVAGHRGCNADGLKVFRRDGQPCPRCGTRIERAVVTQRGTHFCPHCQQRQ